VTKTRSFFGTGSTQYTGTNLYLTYRGHVRGQEPFYVSGSTETPIGPYVVNDVDWKGRVTTAAQYSSDPTWSSVLTGDGYSAYASSTSSNRLTQAAALYDDLGRIYQSQQYDISQSSGTGTNYLAKNAFYDRNDRVVASAPAYAAGIEAAYDGAGRPYESRTVTALQSTPYSSGAYQYCAPTPVPTLSSMSGGDGGVLEMTHQTLDANGNVLETDTFEDNHDDVTGSNPGINLTSNNDYVRRTVFSWYDSANRLTTTADYGSGDTASGAGQWKYATIPTRPSSAYAYDGLSRRTLKAIYVSGALDHKEHAYFNETWQVLEIRKEVSGTISANPLEQYVWHESYIDAPVLRDYDVTTSGSPTRYYYTFDSNFHVTAATTSSGSPVERYNYSPFGGLVYLNASFTPLTTQQSQIGSSLSFIGRQFDAESGLYYFRSRYYHAELGIFVSRDAESYVDGLSLYAAYFVPTDVDPTGLCMQLQDGPANIGTETPGGTWAGKKPIPTNQVGGFNYNYRIDLNFTPNANFGGTLTDIKIIQIIKKTYTTGNEGGDAVTFASFQARKGPGNWYVDRLPGRESGWYGQKNKNQGGGYNTSEIKYKGNSVVYYDKPGSNSVLSNDQGVEWEFQTFAIERKGNGGQVLGGVKWGFTVDTEGHVISSAKLRQVTSLGDFRGAINAWNDQADLDDVSQKARSTQVKFGTFTAFPGNQRLNIFPGDR
jgi:RHS repeat-associated protein